MNVLTCNISNTPTGIVWLVQCQMLFLCLPYATLWCCQGQTWSRALISSYEFTHHCHHHQQNLPSPGILSQPSHLILLHHHHQHCPQLHYHHHHHHCHHHHHHCHHHHLVFSVSHPISSLFSFILFPFLLSFSFLYFLFTTILAETLEYYKKEKVFVSKTFCTIMSF